LILAPAGDREPPWDWLDSSAFLRSAQLAVAGRDLTQVKDALALYTGDYLPEEPYEDWAIRRREQLRMTYHGLMLQAADLAQEHGDVGFAETVLSELLQRDPYHEDAAAGLIRLLERTGRQAAAARVYETLAKALADDLGVQPRESL